MQTETVGNHNKKKENCVFSILSIAVPKPSNGWRYPLVGGMRQRRFAGTNSKPRKLPENAQTPTGRVHYPGAVPGRCVGCNWDYRPPAGLQTVWVGQSRLLFPLSQFSFLL